MALKGNVEAFSLAAIFQSINANQHSGTLRVEKGKNKKLIYFTKGEVYLLSEGVKKMRKMGYHLVKNKIVSEADIQDALVEQREASKLLGEILKERGLISDDDINKILVNQIEEEIYSVFSWRYATFEFIKDFFPPEFINPSKDVKKVAFQTNSLLMEAARRMDDWQRIEDIIPTDLLIFKWGNISINDVKFETSQENVEERLKLIDGKRSVERLISKWQMDRYEGFEFLMLCALQKAIEPISPPELAALFQDAFGRRDFKKCFQYYEITLHTNREQADQFELKIFTNPEFISSSTNYRFYVEKLKGYNLSKLILTLFDNRVIGTLKISSGVSSKSIFFTGDNIWFTSQGKNSTKTLLDFFFRFWNISNEIQQQLLEVKSKTSKKSLQEEIIQNGVVTAEEFDRVLQEKLHEEFCEMYLWNEISLEFIKNECPEEFAESPEYILKPRQFGMNTPEVHEFLSYWNKLICRIPSKKMLFFLAAKRVDQLVGEREILFYLDGKTSIEELYEKVQLPLSKIFRVIYQGIKDILVSPHNIDKLKYEVDNLIHYGQYMEALKFCRSAIAQNQEAAEHFKQKIAYLEQYGYFSFNGEEEFKLEGDLVSFSLAEILQTLNLNKDTGTLDIFTPEKSKEIYFCQGEVYMLIKENQGKSAMADMLGLGEKQDTFNNPLSNFLTEDNISAAEITRIKEQILDVFIWEGANFEYSKNYLPPAFWNPPMGITKLSLDTNTFLVDAIQHIVHWEDIRNTIYSLNSIYIFENPELKMEAINKYPKNPQAIYPIDGRHTIDDVLRISKIRKYDLMDLFYDLSKEEFIRPLKAEEAQEAANAAMAEGKAEECKKFYTHIQELENRESKVEDLDSL